MSTFSQTILITGGTSGLGYHCALQLAKEQPTSLLVIASRSDKDSTAATINKTLNQENVIYLPLDLSSTSNIRTFAAQWATKNYPPIQSLLLNAGLQILEVSYTEDGIEKTFAINHIGHCLLFYLLRPHLTNNARILITASGTHDPRQKTGMPPPIYTSAEVLAHPTSETAKYSGRQRYATSKLCNVMWTYAVQRHIDATADPKKDWHVVAFDPGFMPGTGLARDAGPIVRFLFVSVLPRLLPLMRMGAGPNIHTPQESAAALARLATAREVEGEKSVYFEGREKIKSSADSYDVAKQEDLWAWTARNIARNESERREFQNL